MTWREEQDLLEKAFINRLKVEHGIEEVTTKRQAKNGTREFEFPVHCWNRELTRHYVKNRKPFKYQKLRIACFKSGYVRKQNGVYAPYQLNPTYNQEQRYCYLDSSGKLVTRKGKSKARALITPGLPQLVFMLNYYLKNYY